MTVLDASVVNVALPSIQRDLDFSLTDLTWVVDAYLLAYAGFLLLGGRAADLVGRSRLFVGGVALFSVASLACGLSVEPWQLVVSRGVQGLGAALVAPAALALITDIFPEGRQRNKALGIWGGMAGVGGAAGVMLGGLLTAAAWEWAFLINVPIGGVVLVAALRMLPASMPTATSGLDLTGALTGTAGLGLLIYGVVRGGAQGWGSVATLAEFAVAALLLAAFVVRQRTATAPLVPTELFRRRNIVIGNATIPLVGVLLFATFFVVTLYMQQVRGYSPIEAGLIYVPINVTMLAGAYLAPRLAARVGPPKALMAGLLVQAGALAWWASVLEAQGGVLSSFLLPIMVWSCGLGMSIVSAYVVCTSGLTGSNAGVASGLATTTYQSGGAIGLAVLSAIAAYRTDSLLGERSPSGPGAADALVSGYAASTWVAVAVAVAGAGLARLLAVRSSSSRYSGIDEPNTAADAG
ncbi:MAG: MFS transporter [Pseudonocardiaceae bacterium]